MSTLGEVIARIRAVLGKTSQARQALNQAGESLGEANQYLTHALDGSQDPEAEHVLGLLAQARSGIDDTYRGLVETENGVQRYLNSLAGDTADPPAPAPMAVTNWFRCCFPKGAH